MIDTGDVGLIFAYNISRVSDYATFCCIRNVKLYTLACDHENVFQD